MAIDEETIDGTEQSDNGVFEEKYWDKSFSELASEFIANPRLRKVEITNCFELETIPEEIKTLADLVEFSILRSHLQSFPDGFWALKNLKSLEIIACPDLEEIPLEIGLLENLESFTIIGCEKVSAAPGWLTKLTKLTTLRIINCSGLALDPGEALPGRIVFYENDREARILAEMFPIGIPEGSRSSILRVVHPDGQTLALFSDQRLIKEAKKGASLEKYCEMYDAFYEDYKNWLSAGIRLDEGDPQEQEDEYNACVKNLRYDLQTIIDAKVRGFYCLYYFLVRLAYPFHCDIPKIVSLFQDQEDVIKLASISDDINLVKKAWAFRKIDLAELAPFIIVNGSLYKNPEYWLDKNNLDDFIQFSIKANDPVPIAFLLEYKNKLGYNQDFSL